MSWFVFGFLYQLMNQVTFSSGWFWHFVLLYRGHTVKAVCESFHLSKDAGFKVSFFVEWIWIINYFLFGDTIINYYILPALQVVTHMMPDLPNVGLERDIEQFIVSFFIHIIVKQSHLCPTNPLVSSLFSGILWKSCLSGRWFENLSNPGHSWHRWVIFFADQCIKL